ncbi:23S rRNA (pseudouridine(1915)-N(3))-methyltransferase RlmH [Candidatus Saccharibacteria bacterium]|nr:23S rRNA (pseudouridine(1915)-N(3))-methyltransferase RlmH [Candidatus Saccharibacteria bacterium]
MIRIVAGGKASKGWILDGVSEYSRRLKKPFDVSFEFFEEDKLARFLEKWPFSSSSEFVILLDERGSGLSSVEFSEKLSECFNSSREVIIIIGGAYGVSPEVRERADFVWSFSRQVFPHELMRVMLAEQIYRAQEISRGGKYHHE